jgi:hypothetical protein
MLSSAPIPIAVRLAKPFGLGGSVAPEHYLAWFFAERTQVPSHDWGDLFYGLPHVFIKYHKDSTAQLCFRHHNWAGLDGSSKLGEGALECQTGPVDSRVSISSVIGLTVQEMNIPLRLPFGVVAHLATQCYLKKAT